MRTSKMHADEVDTDVSLVDRLVSAQFPRWADLPIEPVRFAGTDNALYRLGDDLVVRLPRTERTSGRLEKERQWLPRLAPLLPLAVPAPLADGMPAEGYPFEWSVYRWLQGENATMERVTDLSRLATDLAQFVAALQQIDPTGGPSPGEHNAFRGVPLETRDAQTRAAIVSLRGAIDVGAVTAAWEAALRAPEWEHSPVWHHGDLDSRNMLAEAGRLSAVIDFGCLGVGDPACDVMVAWKVLSGGRARHLPDRALDRRVHLGSGSRLGALPGANGPVLLHPGDERRARPGGSTMDGRGTRRSRVDVSLTRSSGDE